MILVGCGDSESGVVVRGQAADSTNRGTVEIPTVVVVSIDTLRADHLPAYGYTQGSTPHLDRIAAEGVLFENAFSTAPLTLPSHASMFTGRWPHVHGVRGNSGYQLDDQQPLLAEQLSVGGYRTGGFISAFVLRSATGIARGFDHFDDQLPGASNTTLSERVRTGRRTVGLALDWLQKQGQAPVFLFVHLYEPHAPYEPPAPFGQGAASAYDGEISAADAAVGELLAGLEATGRYNDAMILVVSDHGEGLRDHGEEEHGILLYRESIQIPMILRLPESQHAGTRVAMPTSLVDVVPTILELTGQSALASDGVSLRASFEGSSLGIPSFEGSGNENGGGQRALLSEAFYGRLRFGWSGQRSVIQNGHQLIVGPRPELFDLHSDPLERINLARERSAVVARMMVPLETIDLPQAPSKIDAETAAALESLGYVTTTPRVADGPLPDPRTRLASLTRLRDSIDLLRTDPERAVQQLERLAAYEPGMIDAHEMLAVAYETTGRLEEAVFAYQRSLDLGAPRKTVGPTLGGLLIRLGRVDEGLPLVQAGIEGGDLPDETLAYLRFLRTTTLLNLDRTAEAEWSARDNVAELGTADAHYHLGLLLVGEGAAQEAEAEFRRALQLAADHPAALADLATLLTVQRRFDEARALFSRLLAEKPDDPDVDRHYRWFLDQVGSPGT